MKFERGFLNDKRGIFAPRAPRLQKDGHMVESINSTRHPSTDSDDVATFFPLALNDNDKKERPMMTFRGSKPISVTFQDLLNDRNVHFTTEVLSDMIGCSESFFEVNLAYIHEPYFVGDKPILRNTRIIRFQRTVWHAMLRNKVFKDQVLGYHLCCKLADEVARRGTATCYYCGKDSPGYFLTSGSFWKFDSKGNRYLFIPFIGHHCNNEQCKKVVSGVRDKIPAQVNKVGVTLCKSIFCVADRPSHKSICQRCGNEPTSSTII